MIYCNATESARALSDLTSYAQANLVDACGAFVCARAASCRASVSERDTRSGRRSLFVSGESPYIGARFALTDSDGRNFRVVVIGKERGGDDPNISIGRRGEIIEHYLATGSATKHLRGTFLALETLLVGEDARLTGEIVLGTEREHVAGSFALVNSLACWAKSMANVRASDPTPTMRRNCSGHLRGMLEVLAPTVIIVQGNVAHASLHRQLPAVPPKPTGGVVDIDLNGRATVLCSFSHPSPPGRDQWWQPGTAYFRANVRPAMLEARRRLRERSGS